MTQTRRLAANAADAKDEGDRLRQMHNTGIMRPGCIFAAHLLWQVVGKAPREREDEGHDGRADVIVEYLAKICGHHRVGDKLRVVETGRRGDLRGLEPPEASGRTQHLRRYGTERGLGLGDV